MGLFRRKKEVEKEAQVEEKKLETPSEKIELGLPELKLPEIKIEDISSKLGLQEIKESPATKEVKEIELKPLPTEVKPAPELKIEEKLPAPEIKGPIFVKITKYKTVLDAIEKIAKQISSLESDLTRLQDIKSREDNEIKKISDEIAEMKRKISEIEASLFSKLE
ncbi:MAG: hypothetical protein QW622_01285 [Candidatus Pacearchaeota archaeon]